MDGVTVETGIAVVTTGEVNWVVSIGEVNWAMVEEYLIVPFGEIQNLFWEKNGVKMFSQDSGRGGRGGFGKRSANKSTDIPVCIYSLSLFRFFELIWVSQFSTRKLKI